MSNKATITIEYTEDGRICCVPDLGDNTPKDLKSEDEIIEWLASLSPVQIVAAEVMDFLYRKYGGESMAPPTLTVVGGTETVH